MAIDRPGAAHRPRVILLSSAVIVLAFVGQTAVPPAVGLSATIPLVLTSVRAGRGAGIAHRSSRRFRGGGLLLDLTGSGVLGIGALVGCARGPAGGIQVDRWRWSGLVRVWLYTLAAVMVMTVPTPFAGLGTACVGHVVLVGRRIGCVRGCSAACGTGMRAVVR